MKNRDRSRALLPRILHPAFALRAIPNPEPSLRLNEAIAIRHTAPRPVELTCKTVMMASSIRRKD